MHTIMTFFCSHPIQLDFPEAIYIQKIFIYETYNGGGVTKVAIHDATRNTYVTVYEGEARCITHSRIFEVDVEVAYMNISQETDFETHLIVRSRCSYSQIPPQLFVNCNLKG